MESNEASESFSAACWHVELRFAESSITSQVASPLPSESKKELFTWQQPNMINVVRFARELAPAHGK
jgi:hypothetical protein